MSLHIRVRLQAEAFAALVNSGLIGIAGAVKTIVALLKKPDNRSAAITCLGKTAELCMEQVWLSGKRNTLVFDVCAHAAGCKVVADRQFKQSENQSVACSVSMHMPLHPTVNSGVHPLSGFLPMLGKLLLDAGNLGPLDVELMLSIGIVISCSRLLVRSIRLSNILLIDGHAIFSIRWVALLLGTCLLYHI